MDDQILAEHMKEDARFQEEQRIVNNAVIEKIDTLATKKDIELLNNEMKGYIIGGNVFKFTFENGGKITAFLGLFVILGMIIKYGIPGLIAFFIHSVSNLKSNL